MLLLYYSLLFAALYLYAGLGLTLLLCSDPLRKHVLFLSPVVGFSACALAGWYCHLADFGGTDRYGPALLVPPAVFLYVALVRSRRGHEGGDRLLDSESRAALMLGGVAFLVLVTPMLRNPDGLTVVSLGNNDVAISSTSARYVKEFPRSQTIDFLRRGKNDYVYPPVVRFGSAFATALPSSLFSLQTYQLENVAACVFFGFVVLLVYSLARQEFRYRHLAALAVAGCCGLSPVLFYTIYQGFTGQVIAMALGLSLTLVLIPAMDHCRTIRECAPYAGLAALLSWGLVVTYPHMLPLVYAPLVVYVLLLGARPAARATVVPRLLLLLAVAGLGFLPSPSRALSFVRYFLFMGDAVAGWHMPVLSPATLLGLTFDRAYLQASSGLWSGVSWAAGAVLVFFGLRRTAARDPQAARLAASYLGVVLAGYLALAAAGGNAAEWGGYRSYKLVSFFLPYVLLGSLLLVRDLEFPPRTAGARLLAAGLLALLAGNLVSAWRCASTMARTHQSVGRELVDLQRIESDARISSINIHGSDIWNMMWQANFLLRKKLYLGPGTYYQPIPLEGAWDLERSGQTGDDVLHVAGFDDDAEIRVNELYRLVKVGARLRARLGEGWYAAEAGHRWAGDGDRARVVLFAAAGDLAVDMEAEGWPLNAANHLTVSLNGDRLAACPGNGICRINGIVLRPGRNLLDFVPSLPPTAPGSGDPRRLSYAFSSINFNAADLRDRRDIRSP